MKTVYYSDSFVFEAWTWTWFCNRFRPFIMYSMNVSDPSSSLTVQRSWPFLCFSGLKKVIVENGSERFISVYANGQERLGTFEPGRSNALERIVENVHGTFTFTLQKRKNHCNLFPMLFTDRLFLKIKFQKYFCFNQTGFISL